MREVLDDAATRMNDSVPDHPEVEAALRRTVGRTYSMIGEYDRGTPHLERASNCTHKSTATLRPKQSGRLHLADNLLNAGERSLASVS